MFREAAKFHVDVRRMSRDRGYPHPLTPEPNAIKPSPRKTTVTPANARGAQRTLIVLSREEEIQGAVRNSSSGCKDIPGADGPVNATVEESLHQEGPSWWPPWDTWEEEELPRATRHTHTLTHDSS